MINILSVAGFLKTEVCYKLVGCFNNSGPFSDMFRRPINMLPADPQTMDIEFNLFTRTLDGKERMFLNEPDILTSSAFNSSNQVKFIVHGYMDNSEFQWVTVCQFLPLKLPQLYPLRSTDFYS